jgi:hypothetical protein
MKRKRLIMVTVQVKINWSGQKGNIEGSSDERHQ